MDIFNKNKIDISDNNDDSMLDHQHISNNAGNKEPVDLEIDALLPPQVSELPSSDELDTAGIEFNSKIHSGRKDKKGKWLKRRGVKAGNKRGGYKKDSDCDPVDSLSKKVSAQALATMYHGTHALLFEDVELNKTMRDESLVPAIEHALITYNIGDIPAWLLLSSACAQYTGEIAAREKNKSKTQELFEKFKKFFSFKKKSVVIISESDNEQQEKI